MNIRTYLLSLLFFLSLLWLSPTVLAGPEATPEATPIVAAPLPTAAQPETAIPAETPNPDDLAGWQWFLNWLVTNNLQWVALASFGILQLAQSVPQSTFDKIVQTAQATETPLDDVGVGIWGGLRRIGQTVGHVLPTGRTQDVFADLEAKNQDNPPVTLPSDPITPDVNPPNVPSESP